MQETIKVVKNKIRLCSICEVVGSSVVWKEGEGKLTNKRLLRLYADVSVINFLKLYLLSVPDYMHVKCVNPTVCIFNFVSRRSTATN